MQKEDLQAAIEHGCESETVEYKASFNPRSSGEWLEILKDVVALANSGGGVIIIGVEDSGALADFDAASLADLDPADLTNKLYKYTGQQFANFEFVAIASNLFGIVVKTVAAPIVFVKPGTYDTGADKPKQKTSFSAGTVYFRHGAKSEPGNADDLRWFIERRVEELRKSWLEGIVKVVEAPAGSHIQIVPASVPQASAHLVNDSSAPAYYRVPIDTTHPFRQKEVVEELNKRLKGAGPIKAFHVQCVRQAHHIDENPNFCYKQHHAATRYTQLFVEWVVEQYKADTGFFKQAKATADELRRAKVAPGKAFAPVGEQRRASTTKKI